MDNLNTIKLKSNRSLELGNKKTARIHVLFFSFIVELSSSNYLYLSPDDDLAVANDVDATWQLLESVGGLDVLLE